MRPAGTRAPRSLPAARPSLLPAAYRRLVRAAAQVRRRAYAPYSRFPVGAAVLAADGTIYPGCNVENVSTGMTICAERVAVTTAVAAGQRRLVAAAVVGAAGITPCGACRQVMDEFGIKDVILAGARDIPRVLSLRELLPLPFHRRLKRAYHRRLKRAAHARL